ncbi:MAG TPA: c-type cytochrome [Pyrinomonadaceae bacterium]|nr:c-type cytochrome [Pyrinomonadaceae bacterium]
MLSKNIKYALASIALGLTLGFVAANLRATNASASTQAFNQPLALQGGGGEDKPVEQVRKNIQVLKGLPASQLFPLMNFIGASLGVKCDYCHVIEGKNAEGQNNWIWESDAKETKRTARRMMQMVLNVNNTNRADFRGEPVTCYTCHRGQREPARFPQLPLTVSAHEDGPARAAVKPAEALPTVEQIMNKYVAVVGGREAAAKLQSRVMKGTIEQTQGRSAAVEINLKEPGKYLSVLTTKQQGIIYQGFDGTTAWIKNDRAQRAMNAAELAQLKRAAALYDVIKVKEPYTGMTVTGREKVGEREAYVVELKNSDASRTERYFFDTETGLLLRRIVLTNGVLFPIPEQTDFEDYREVDGVKLPFTIRISNIDTFFSSTRTFTEIKHNVAVDDTRFNPPPAPSPPKP